MTRILLFDIDMTLLNSGGAGRLAMRRTFHELYGIEDGYKHVEFAGRTDWALLRQAMEQQGVMSDDTTRFEDEMRRFQDRYHAVLTTTLGEAEGGCVMPGIPELLDALSNREGVRLGIQTGNFRAAAYIKLEYFGLDAYVSEGGFGEDAEDRRDIVGVAIERLSGGEVVDPSSIWVIGDTQREVAAAHAHGVRALGVATGRDSVRELHAAGAELAIDDLSNTELVLRTLLADGLSGSAPAETRP